MYNSLLCVMRGLVAFVPMLLTYGIPMDNTAVDDYGHIWKGVDLLFKPARYKPPPFQPHPVAKPFGKELLGPAYDGETMFGEVHDPDYDGGDGTTDPPEGGGAAAPVPDVGGRQEEKGGGAETTQEDAGGGGGDSMFGEVHGPDYVAKGRGPDYDGESMFGEVHGSDYDVGDVDTE
jgi:hypothetical protein